jgi:GNAT superfamily N-acetyltransferase
VETSFNSDASDEYIGRSPARTRLALPASLAVAILTPFISWMTGSNVCTVREAAVSDAAAIARLVTQLGYPSSTDDMTGRLHALGARPEYVTMVAEQSGTIVGLVGAYVAHGLELNGAYGKLTGLVVDDASRGCGIGRLLIESIEQWLLERDVTVVILTSGKHRTDAHQFYRRLGYEDTGLRFIKRLSASTSS